MIKPKKFQRPTEFPARTRDEIPAAAIGQIHATIEDSLGEPFSTQYPEFAEAFPLTAPIIDQFWSPMFLIYQHNEVHDRWYPLAILESRDDRPNLMPEVNSASSDPYPADFLDGTGMLPPRWRELYRWLNSFGLESPHLRRARSTHLLPSKYESRKDAEDFIDILGVHFPDRFSLNRKTINKVFDPIGAAHPYPNGRPSKVQCWCLTDQAESLWVPFRGNGAVYHVRGDQFDDAAELRHPEDRLDEYMALLLKEGTTEGFDFRR